MVTENRVIESCTLRHVVDDLGLSALESFAGLQRVACDESGGAVVAPCNATEHFCVRETPYEKANLHTRRYV